MLFSILIANFNNGKYFKECYDSVIGQTYADWEVIIVDDASTDNSVEIIQVLISDDPRFKFYENETNNGCGYTKRKCAELAAGEICGFVDPDDSLEFDALELMVKAHAENPGASLVHSTFNFCNEFLVPTAIYHVAGEVSVNERFTNLDAKVNHFSSFKNLAYKNTEGIDQHLLRAVDQDLYLKLSEKGSFYFINKALYNYRIHGTGIATSNVDKAFYWFLKVIAKTEERRGVNLENEVAQYLNRTDPRNVAFNLANPRYLLLKLSKAFKTNPSRFLRRLILNR